MIQIDFWTQITMLSSWPGHVSVSGRPEWKAQSVSVIEARPTHLHQGMLITRAWPGPLWAGRDKENQFPSCQTLPPPDLCLEEKSRSPTTYCPDGLLFSLSLSLVLAPFWAVVHMRKERNGWPKDKKKERAWGGPPTAAVKSQHLCDWAEVKPIEYLEPILSAAGEMRYWQCCWVLSQLSRLIGLGGRPWANWICCGLINSGKLFYLLFFFFFPGQPNTRACTHSFRDPFFSSITQQEKHHMMELIFLSLFPAGQSNPGKKEWEISWF